MSLLELIAQRSPQTFRGISLPEILAEQALTHLSQSTDKPTPRLLTECFSGALLEPTSLAAREYVALLRENGVSIDRILDDYFPATAAYLGQCWLDDTLSFSDVTHAMGHLTVLARDLTFEADPMNRSFDGPGAILLALVPGEDHALGTILAAHKLRAKGWVVQLELSVPSPKQLAHMVKPGRFDVIGLSCGARRTIPVLTECVEQCRSVATDATIAIGGGVVDMEPDLKGITCADITISPAQSAHEVLKDGLKSSVR